MLNNDKLLSLLIRQTYIRTQLYLCNTIIVLLAVWFAENALVWIKAPELFFFYYIVVQNFPVEHRCYKSTKILKLLLPDIFHRHIVCVDLDYQLLHLSWRKLFTYIISGFVDNFIKHNHLEWVVHVCFSKICTDHNHIPLKILIS